MKSFMKPECHRLGSLSRDAIGGVIVACMRSAYCGRKPWSAWRSSSEFEMIHSEDRRLPSRIVNGRFYLDAIMASGQHTNGRGDNGPHDLRPRIECAISGALRIVVLANAIVSAVPSRLTSARGPRRCRKPCRSLHADQPGFSKSICASI